MSFVMMTENNELLTLQQEAAAVHMEIVDDGDGYRIRFPLGGLSSPLTAAGVRSLIAHRRSLS